MSAFISKKVIEKAYEDLGSKKMLIRFSANTNKNTVSIVVFVENQKIGHQGNISLDFIKKFSIEYVQCDAEGFYLEVEKSYLQRVWGAIISFFQ